jgi:hypothetical protein
MNKNKTEKRSDILIYQAEDGKTGNVKDIKIWVGIAKRGKVRPRERQLTR